MTTADQSRFTVLRRAGVGVVLHHPDAGLPAVAHWGKDLGPLTDADLDALLSATDRQTPPATLDAAWFPTVLPQETDGWSGRPGLVVTRDGTPALHRWVVTATDTDPSSARVEALDETTGLMLRTHIMVLPGGAVTVAHSLTNSGPDPVEVHWLEATLPVPRVADRATSFSGRWTREKAPLTTELARGAVTRQTRRGRGGHDSPHVSVLSDGPPRNRTGDLWAVHLGWSADCTYRTDRMPEGTPLLGAGELLRPGEVVLAPDDEYHAPLAWFAWSDSGLDGLSERFHAALRSRPHHPVAARPLVLNTWEAVYFDHDPRTIIRLAERAADVGVERFVLDDGWFPARRDDTKGLGDWVVDRTVWPDGLGPLADRVHELGMQFGLWFEPEMVNLDSDLARAHPDWLLHDPAHIQPPQGLSWRTQHVLDLAHPDAYEHIRSHIDALVRDLGIDFIKWDHNRDLVAPVHAGRPGTHAQTHATYRLLRQLKEDHPGLEIESCSSGGARTDLGILDVTDRVWASDSNDPVERQDIQRWTGLLLPPELIGAHVGPSTSHSSGRVTSLAYRAATSLMGSAGFEWNLLECTADELDQVRAFAGLYKELRHVVHTGTVVHADTHDPAFRVTGAVSPERDEGVWTIATVSTPEEALPERVRLHGLDATRRYRVRVRDDVGVPEHWQTPPWITAGEVILPGQVLSTVGLQVPTLWPGQALILHLTAV